MFWQTKIFFARRGVCWPSSKGPPLWNFCTYEELFLPFSIFPTHWYANLQGYMYTNTSQGEHCATPPPNPNTHSLKAHSPSSLHELRNGLTMMGDDGQNYFVVKLWLWEINYHITMLRWWWAELLCCIGLIMSCPRLGSPWGTLHSYKAKKTGIEVERART